MRVYKRLPEMVKWKKFTIYMSMAAIFIFYAHTDTFLIVISLILLSILAFVTISFVCAKYIMGNSDDLSFFNKLLWFEERKIDTASNAEVAGWCAENLEDKWRHAGGNRFLIKNELDAMAFKLRWA